MSTYIPKVYKEDISTYANIEEIRQKHMDINLKVDFNTNTAYFTNIIKFEVLKENIDKITLDANKIKINSVESADLKNIHYEIHNSKEISAALGTPITIHFDPISQKEIEITIKSEASEDSPALQFLKKEQTTTQKYPFMFTQCEPILCRSLFPIQDSPSVKLTSTATIETDKDIVGLYSGILVDKKECDSKVVYKYQQKVPMPTYLSCFAIGELEYGKISDRCGVWTEKGLVQKALYDFAETEKFIKIAEDYLDCPYAWGKYDILVLPFSFPYGGMENPCLTFVTPSLLSGDRSLANVVAHEISHSWTGNLVTNKDWSNFWLNEGFTVFLERKIDEKMYGPDITILDKVNGQSLLKRDILLYGVEHNFTSLSPNYDGVDPDDGFSQVPYEKGATFLEYLENICGKDTFQKVMQKYIKTYQFKSVKYEDFKHIYEDVVKDEKLLKTIDWEKWIKSPGFPLVEPCFKSVLIEQANKLAEDFINNKVDINDTKKCEDIFNDFIKWHTNHKLAFLDYFIQNIEKLNDDVYINLKKVFKFNHFSYNMEIKNFWFQICLKSKHDDCINDIKNFVTKIGRMKYIKPIFMEWFIFNPDDAQKYFNEIKYLYHPICVKFVQNKFDSIRNKK